MPITIDAQRNGDKLVLALTGTLDAPAATALLRAIRAPLRRGQAVVLDLSAVQSADTFGVAALAESVLMARRRRGASLRAIGAGGKLRDQLAAQSDPEETVTPRPPGFLESWGSALIDGLAGMAALMQLLADTFYWCVLAPLRRKLPPPGATTDQAVRIGLDAAPIVMLIGFLMGLIMAFQAAYQLRQFGANIYVANLVGLAMVRELGPLMTAIIIAGRSGSAIAAELGTMTVGEEIDALRTMGIDPVRFLVVPRVYAISMTQPALSLFSMALGIMGGFLIAVFFLDLSASAYLKQTITSLTLANLFEGLTKSLVFSWVIVMIGCHSGLRITGGAVGVGRATTTSVVASIFSIIIVDSIFTTLSTVLG